MSKLLFDEPPISISPTLATILSLNEAVVLQQVHYYVELAKKTNHNYVDGRYWVYNTYEEWRDMCFPFWSLNTIKRTFASLENSGIIISANHNKSGLDKRKWYSINYDVLDSKVSDFENRDKEKDTDRPKMGRSSGPKWDDVYNIYNNIYNKTKNTTKNTKILNGAFSQNENRNMPEPFDKEKLRDQVYSICYEQGVNDIETRHDIFNLILYYYSVYWKVMRREHPRINRDAMQNVVGSFNYDLLGVYEYDECEAIIRRHFQTDYSWDIDFNICHFASDEIIRNRGYEVLTR